MARLNIGGLLVAASLLTCGPSEASAQGAGIPQGGSYGGAIGNMDKSVSGSEAPSKAAPSSRREAPKRRSFGGNYDGTWSVQSTGQNCPINTSTAVIISGRRVIGQGGTGTVSPSGAVRTVGTAGSISFTGQGQLSGRSGYGVFRQSDGCTGRWVAMKQ